MRESRAGRTGWLRLGVLMAAAAAVGFLAMRGWHARSSAAASPTERAGAAEPAPPRGAPDTGEPRRGSSISVVGGMSPEDMAKLGIKGPAGAQAPVVPSSPATRLPGGALPGAPTAPPPAALPTERLGPATALRFPSDVQQAALRYQCLCGCPHNLARCDCNEQPVGAGTMLSYLEQQIRKGLAPDRVDAAMIDRYGDRVRATTSTR